jgi:hypothetical protein
VAAEQRDGRKRSGAERNESVKRLYASGARHFEKGGRPAGAGPCLVLGIKGIKKGIGKRTVVVKPGMPEP